MTLRPRVVCRSVAVAAVAGFIVMPGAGRSGLPGAGVVLDAAAPVPAGVRPQDDQGARVTRTIKVGPHSSLTLSNIAGNISVTGGGGDAIRIDAVKHAGGGSAARFNDVRVDIAEHGNRVEVRTLPFGGEHSSVDYTVTVPADTAVYLRSVSGNVTVTRVQGGVRADSVSGNVTADATAHLDRLRSVSGNVDIRGASSDTDLATGSISGRVTIHGLKAQGLDVSTISGNLTLDGVTCDHLTVRTVSGEVRYAGPLARNGRYEVTSHSGDVHLVLTGDPGFELNASSFSGDITSQFPIAMHDTGEDHGRFGPLRHAIRGTYGDASALLTIRTFSGDITLQRR